MIFGSIADIISLIASKVKGFRFNYEERKWKAIVRTVGGNFSYMAG